MHTGGAGFVRDQALTPFGISLDLIPRLHLLCAFDDSFFAPTVCPDDSAMQLVISLAQLLTLVY